MTERRSRKKTPLTIEFGRRVRRRRYFLTLSIEELAEKSGLHPNYIGSVERGERNISLQNISALAKALHCSVGELFPEEHLKDLEKN